MIRFLHSDLWHEITLQAKKSKRRRVAVAYLGKGAAELLPLRKSDQLVVNMSMSNVKNGLVNPVEIENYFNKGVQIFNCKNLHSKVYLFDKAAIICSGNISSNSYSDNGLIEAGLLTDDKRSLKNVAAFIDDISSEIVSKAYIDLCKKSYHPPKGTGLYGKGLLRKSKIETSNLWIVNVHPVEFNDEEEAILVKGQKLFEAQLKNRDDYKVGSIKYGAASTFIRKVKKGDLVMQIWNYKKRSIIQEPVRVLGVTEGRTINAKGHKNMFLRIEEKLEPKEDSWTAFEKYLRQNQIPGITKKSTKQIRDEDVKRILRDFWNL